MHHISDTARPQDVVAEIRSEVLKLRVKTVLERLESRIGALAAAQFSDLVDRVAADIVSGVLKPTRRYHEGSKALLFELARFLKAIWWESPEIISVGAEAFICRLVLLGFMVDYDLPDEDGVILEDFEAVWHQAKIPRGYDLTSWAAFLADVCPVEWSKSSSKVLQKLLSYAFWRSVLTDREDFRLSVTPETALALGMTYGSLQSTFQKLRRNGFIEVVSEKYAPGEISRQLEFRKYGRLKLCPCQRAALKSHKMVIQVHLNRRIRLQSKSQKSPDPDD